METLLVFLSIIILCVIGIRWSLKNQKKLKVAGYSKNNMINMVKYTCGHPQIDKPNLYNIAIKDKNVYFLNLSNKEIATIPVDKIKNILVEDETTISRRVTVARLLLTGVFAFGLKKKKKEELSYVTIEWNDGRFEHETVFEFEKHGALQRANAFRNKLISLI